MSNASKQSFICGHLLEEMDARLVSDPTHEIFVMEDGHDWDVRVRTPNGASPVMWVRNGSRLEAEVLKAQLLAGDVPTDFKAVGGVRSDAVYQQLTELFTTRKTTKELMFRTRRKKA